MLQPDQLEIYRHATYRVFAEPAFTLAIGSPSSWLAALYRQRHVSSAAFITACNPYGALLAADLNAVRQQALEASLQQQGWQWLPGQGEGSAEHTQNTPCQWPPEASCLVFGIRREEAAELGRQYQQNAIVFCGSDAVPELLVLV